MRPDGPGAGAPAGPEGAHLDDGEAHAFVDGALGDVEAARVIAHVAACERCAGVLAEARGLAAAATRILGALDDVPRRVVPAAGPVGATSVPGRVRPRPASPRRWTGWRVRAAAALLLAAGLGSAVWQADFGRRAADSSSVPAALPSATAPAMAPAAPAAADRATRAGSGAAVTARATDAVARATRPAPAAAAARGRRRDAAEPSGVEAASRAEPARAGAAAPEVATAPPPPPAPPPPAVALAPALPAPGAGDVAGAAGAAVAAGAVRGVVTDPDGRPVASAQVHVAGTAAGATTDSAGRFVVAGVPAGSAALRVRRVGFGAESVAVAVGAGDTARAVVRLRPATQALSQVVVTGLATERASDAVAGCYAVRGAAVGRDSALPPYVRLAGGVAARRRRTARRAGGAGAAVEAEAAPVAGAALDSLGAALGRWTLAGDTLVVRWAGAPPAPLRLAEGGWAGPGLSLDRVAAAGGGCPPR